MNAGNIVEHCLDFEVIKTFQELDPRYSAKKFEKLEKRLTTRDEFLASDSLRSTADESVNRIEKVAGEMGLPSLSIAITVLPFFL